MLLYLMKYFITGSTGFVGVHFLKLLQSKKSVEKIYILVRNKKKLEQRITNKNKIKIISGDLFSLKNIPEDTQFIVHLAGLTKSFTPELFYKINRDGVKNIIKKALKLKDLKKFILVSSLAAAGPSENSEKIDETEKERPVSTYGKSKLAGEKLALEYKQKIPLTIIRPPAVYGEWDTDFLEIFKLSKKRISIGIKHKPEERKVSLVYAKDLANSIYFFSKIKEKRSGEIYYITEPKIYTWKQIEDKSAKILKKKIFLRLTFPLWFGKILAILSDFFSRISNKNFIFNRDKINEIKYKNWICSGKKAKSRNFSVKYDFNNTLPIIINWYKEKGML